jgi:hypothetical protein
MDIRELLEKQVEKQSDEIFILGNKKSLIRI